ncbi:efflux RND transporter periplasmic adaptor subunit [Tropicimonas marinistellae]|uniref:efflux RND transporter periplasmic adaptor subunit n=1 Tax=Tropicimonas marinistellae TaxID=1739787 RepID=UPI00082DEE90|nr:efflux RND transporter periplasmic adaptor subunit [Tropicimonas marinistellae]
MLNRFSCVFFGTVLLSLPLLSTPEASTAQERPAGVETAPVEVVEMSETSRSFGQVVAERESAVAARVAGIAADVPVRVGSRVKRGDILARLDTELFEIEIARAETELSIAEAGVRVADARLDRAIKASERAESLRLNSTIADATVEERQAALDEALGLKQEAMARVASTRNTIERAEYTLRNATIRAPFDGIVLNVATEIGQFVSSGSEVATLLDLGKVEVRANVPANLVDALQPDSAVAGQTGTGAALSLKLRTILPTEYTTTQTRPVLFEILDASTPVAVGQSVSVDLPISAPREVVVVPKDALVQARGGWSVFVNDAGQATPRPVEIGSAVGGGFEVLSGLQAGDEVVIRGNERLRPGQAIAPSNAGPANAVSGAGNAAQPPASGSTPPSALTGDQSATTSPDDETRRATEIADARGEQG